MTRATRRSNRTGRGGFTLIEMMMAMTITAVGLFSIIQSQYVVIRGHAVARERMEATMIANGVMQELRTRGLRWSAMPGSVSTTTFASIFPDIELTTVYSASNMSPDISFGSLRPLQRYLGQTLVTGEDLGVADAPLINTAGQSGTGALRAIYRVHYVAFNLPINPLDATSIRQDLVRIVIIVSWDNKDHGEQDYDWANTWSEEDHFFKRQMFQVSFNLTQNKLW